MDRTGNSRKSNLTDPVRDFDRKKADQATNDGWFRERRPRRVVGRRDAGTLTATARVSRRERDRHRREQNGYPDFPGRNDPPVRRPILFRLTGSHQLGLKTPHHIDHSAD
ncbi:hypothetical protein GWI33_004783 [Rhynchophorus ferrugineus]|uniref:Uncharacterized protein n=1 Tax=Rhynchophorus ferrugineus TaxID=354439 RepID=A0A834MGI5_RHYFE|nr:hypothetical protein GWI33_004783 [Rhynchophorus ferrugineus]